MDGDDTTVIAPHTGDTHWYGGYESLDDNILDVDYTSGDTIDFWTWYFIEEGWDYGFVEALVDGQWVTVPLVDDADTEVTTDTNPHDNNEEGNGLTGTSGGAYFVDDPVYIHLTGSLPEGTTDVQFRYSTDAAYLDTGWFVDDVQIDGDPVAVELRARQLGRDDRRAEQQLGPPDSVAVRPHPERGLLVRDGRRGGLPVSPRGR